MNALPGFDRFKSAIASPALIAVAEQWDQARRGKPLPTWGDLSSSALSPHFKLLWGFQYDPQLNEFAGRLAGAHVAEWLGANFWGARLRDIHSPHVVNEVRQFFKQIMMTPAAGRCSGRLFTMDDRTVTGERIALPIAADGIHGDGILGATDYEYIPVTGKVELIHENAELYPLR